VFFPEIKLPERDADHLPLFRVGIYDATAKPLFQTLNCFVFPTLSQIATMFIHQ
jgi:hypothetical protein